MVFNLFAKVVPHKECPEMLKLLDHEVDALIKSNDHETKAHVDEITKILIWLHEHIKNLCSEEGNQDSPEKIEKCFRQIVKNYFLNGLFTRLLGSLNALSLEARKTFVSVFSMLIRRPINNRYYVAEFFSVKTHMGSPSSNSSGSITSIGSVDTATSDSSTSRKQTDEVAVEALKMIFEQYGQLDTTLVCGILIRECIRFEFLCRKILHSDWLFALFPLMQAQMFDVSSDAFATFRDLLTRHKALVNKFLMQNYQRVLVEGFGELMRVDCNFATRRQAIKLLGEIIMNEINYDLMVRYVTNAENLKVHMNQLLDPSRNIQYEAFHIFKIFVAYPDKPEEIQNILTKNSERLTEYIRKFESRNTNSGFTEERNFLLEALEKMSGGGGHRPEQS